MYIIGWITIILLRLCIFHMRQPIQNHLVLPQHTFTSVTFDTGNYYLGFGAANGGSTDNHILKSMRLSFI